MYVKPLRSHKPFPTIILELLKMQWEFFIQNASKQRMNTTHKYLCTLFIIFVRNGLHYF